MRKRNNPKTSSALAIEIKPEPEKIEINAPKIHHTQNFAAIQATQFSFLPKIKKDLIPTTLESESYDSGYSYSEPEQEIPNQKIEFRPLLDKLTDKVVSNNDDKNVVKLTKEIQDLKSQYQKILAQINEMEATLGPDATKGIWKQKQFFTELIDFVDHCYNVNPADVKEEYLSLENSLNRLRSLRNLDPELYKQIGFQEAANELFEFYAIFEISNFSFKSNDALLDMKWIQAGWYWTDEDGNSDIVPKTFDNACVPIFASILQKEYFNNEQEYRVAYCHCIEICDYCNNDTIAESQLLTQLKRKLEQSYGCGRLDTSSYEKLMDEFGFKNNFGWKINH
ncbi:hypothetical protein GPJ56_006167 [Histomonas meleagridis]|uniref:uncharacterized protein n=1 Tax=Histomonas meleagridis TaxID=135588 RepID=UPI0035598050|nr:hypothetical protein GPJ56_006167 [Histomonas meleagridis]KAH0797017.1 hypothetical protein GO595_010910 [Histomonas meleagridis]